MAPKRAMPKRGLPKQSIRKVLALGGIPVVLALGSIRSHSLNCRAKVSPETNSESKWTSLLPASPLATHIQWLLNERGGNLTMDFCQPPGSEEIRLE